MFINCSSTFVTIQLSFLSPSHFLIVPLDFDATLNLTLSFCQGFLRRGCEWISSKLRIQINWRFVRWCTLYTKYIHPWSKREKERKKILTFEVAISTALWFDCQWQAAEIIYIITFTWLPMNCKWLWITHTRCKHTSADYWSMSSHSYRMQTELLI